MTASTTMVAANLDPNSAEIGKQLHAFIADLYPICRSITGNGLRETLRRIGERIPLEIHEVPTGTAAFDWTIPREWNIRDAYVKNSRGERVIDFQRSNLHVVNYSVPVKKSLSLAELKEHLHTLPDRPELIPYRTSYYKETWGFCLTQRQLDALPEDRYEVVIDSSLENGFLSYGECVVPGETSEEILISCHSCHPSLCNDNLSGVAIATCLAQIIASRSNRFTYRFLFIPTRRGDAEIDRAILHLLGNSGKPFNVRDFSPYGYDERQYCSPGFNLPVGCLNRTQHGKFSQYHTSADNLEFVAPDALADTLRLCLQIFDVLENNYTYLNRNPKGEPQLGKRGLYRSIGGHADAETREMAMLWVLNLSDGQHSLLDIAERSGLNFETIQKAASDLQHHQLLTPASQEKHA